MDPTERVVYDGADELDSLRLATVELPCPSCGAACSFEPSEIARTGTSIGWATSPELAALQEHVLATLSLIVGVFGDSRTLRSSHDDRCTPCVASVACGSCGATSMAVVSYGEVQPARWRLIVEGLVPPLPG